MFNADEIRQITFEKVVRGYRPEDVESFMENIADEFETLAKEKQEIESQLYILAEKIEEYQQEIERYKAEEDSLRTTLIKAQKLGESIIDESRQKAEAILKDANIRKNDILAAAHEEFAMYEENIARIKKETSDFKITVLSMYKDHIESLSRVPELPKEPANVVEEEPAAEEAAKQPETAEEVIAEEPVVETVASEEHTLVLEAEEPVVADKFNNISSLFE